MTKCKIGPLRIHRSKVMFPLMQLYEEERKDKILNFEINSFSFSYVRRGLYI